MRYYLPEHELSETRTNYRVHLLPAEEPGNVFGQSVYILDKKESNYQYPVTLFANLWHSLKWSDRKKAFYLGDRALEVDQYDGIDPELDESRSDHTKEQSDSSDSDKETTQAKEDKKLLSSIRNTPIPLEITSPIVVQPDLPELPQLPFPASSRRAATVYYTMTTTTTQTTQTPQTQTTAQGTTPATPAAPAFTPADVQIALSTFLRRIPGGGGGGGSRGGGGPPPPAGPPQPAQGQHVPPAGAGNVCTMGQLPRVFSGDRSQADDFIDELKSYLLLNYQVAGFNSPITKVTLALTLIKGPEVAGWARDMRLWLESFDPTTQNLPAIWNAFLAEFATQFQDTQRPNRAHVELESLKMKPGEVDQYIAKFEELARQALYNVGDEATTSLFLKGLPAGILIDVFKPPIVTTYEDIKQRAIQSTKSRIIIDSILGTH